MLLTDGLADMRTVIQYGMYIEAFPTLALVELRLGDVDKARQTLAEALHLSADRNHLDSHACTLRSAIAYFAAIGELERAVELYALATRIPFLINSLLCRDLVWASIEQQALSLPPETAAAARARGLQRELWPTIRELAADPHFINP
jgi:tetratricopeptide (TPR) repeat protein